MKSLLFTSLLSCCLQYTGCVLPISEFHVAVNGTPAGDGSAEHPWDLATALNQPSSVHPGDLIWLHGGVYTGTFTSQLAGTSERPITLRQFPGERATIDSGSSGSDGLTIQGQSTWYVGFEIMYSDPVRVSQNPGSYPGDIHRGTCVTVFGPETKLINLVLHDCSQGAGFWIPATNAEMNGNIIYYNGWDGAGQGHGHGIYTQNDSGVKQIRDNIIFNQFGLGIQAYGSGTAYVRNYEIVGNIVFNNGSIGEAGAHLDNILVAGGVPPKDGIDIESNYTYHTPAAGTGYSRLGWQWDSVNGTITARNNYWIGGQPPIGFWYWTKATFSGNTVYSTGMQEWLVPSDPQQQGSSDWSGNHYWGNESFRYNDANLSWNGWKASTGNDATSDYTAGRPHGVWTFVRPNLYEAGRANVVIYNWDLSKAVNVDLSAVLAEGDNFEIRDAENFFAPAVVSGTFNGSPVSIPLTGLTVAAPVGEVPTPPQPTAPEFAAFVVRARRQ
jgi:hypothetical protein